MFLLVLHAIQTCFSLWERCRAATERAGFCSYAQSKPVSPSGRDVAQRQRGLVLVIFFLRFALMRIGSRAALSVICFANASSPKGRAEKPERAAHLTHQAISCANLSACCSFRHGLRRATFLREEGFGFPRTPNLSLPLGEMSRSDREGRLPCEGAGFAAGKD